MPTPNGHRKSYAPREQVRFARHLRSNLTKAEVILWSHLRRRQLNGLRFRRQHPIDQYIADFACIERNLVVEIDGATHFDRGAYDDGRDRVMQGLGWTVLRYVDDDVLKHLEAVLDDIAAHAQGTQSNE